MKTGELNKKLMEIFAGFFHEPMEGRHEDYVLTHGQVIGLMRLAYTQGRSDEAETIRITTLERIGGNHVEGNPDSDSDVAGAGGNSGGGDGDPGPEVASRPVFADGVLCGFRGPSKPLS